jgi:hypothetical protein
MLHNPTLEAKRWASSGHINVARAQWVAGNLRGVGKMQRLRLLKGLGERNWEAPVVWSVSPQAHQNLVRVEANGLSAAVALLSNK